MTLRICVLNEAINEIQEVYDVLRPLKLLLLLSFE